MLLHLIIAILAALGYGKAPVADSVATCGQLAAIYQAETDHPVRPDVAVNVGVAMRRQMTAQGCDTTVLP